MNEWSVTLTCAMHYMLGKVSRMYVRTYVCITLWQGDNTRVRQERYDVPEKVQQQEDRCPSG